MSGLLNKIVSNGSVQLAATIPNAPFSSCNILAVNPLASDVIFTCWITNSETPGVVDLVEAPVVIPANGGKYEQTGRICSPGEKIMVQTTAGVAVRVETVDEV